MHPPARFLYGEGGAGALTFLHLPLVGSRDQSVQVEPPAISSSPPESVHGIVQSRARARPLLFLLPQQFTHNNNNKQVSCWCNVFEDMEVVVLSLWWFHAAEMATLGLSKVFILDKYFTELQKFWETEKKLQGVCGVVWECIYVCVCVCWCGCMDRYEWFGFFEGNNVVCFLYE